MATGNCPGCGANPCELFYELASVPTNNRWLSLSRDQAVALPRGDIALKFCQGCGLVFNGAFDPNLIDGTGFHEERDEDSPIFEAFQRRLADQLIERYALRDKDILEIGHGPGEFLELLCELGANHGIGFDARYAPHLPLLPAGIHVTFRQELLPKNTITPRSDLVCSKNLLQSVPESAQCLKLLKRILHKDARLFLQVSNFMRTLKHIAFWDINYPSCSYFTPGTLYRLLRAQSFAVNDVWTDFDAEYLMADARVAARGNTDSSPSENIETIADLADLVARFAHECRERQAMWCEILRKLAGGGNRIAIWGAGTRTASFLTTLAVGDEVSYVVDMNPGRQGKFTPGTGHRIVAPDVMVSMRPDVVIVMNSVLAFEIKDLLAQAGCAPTLLIA
jgi:SAM-dependent methyltransferase